MTEARSAEAIPRERSVGSPIARLGALLALATVFGISACAQRSGGVSTGSDAQLGARVAECSASTAGNDGDRDGLDDGCELALVRAFAPMLRVDARDCLWRGSGADARLGGGYLFAARPFGGGARLAYLPAFYRDCGWSGPVCLIRARGCAAHAGDSEIILLDVVTDSAGRWSTSAVFLSAHCFGRSDGRCRWFRGAELDAFTWLNGQARGAPRVWVARGKHALYPSRRSCDSGHWLNDSCDGNESEYRYPVRSTAQNIGSRVVGRAGGCLPAARLPLGTDGADLGTQECFWDPGRPFRGWQEDGAGVAPTAYERYLREIGGF